MAENSTGWDVLLFPSPAFKRKLFVGVGTTVAQQAVGIEAIHGPGRLAHPIRGI